MNIECEYTLGYVMIYSEMADEISCQLNDWSQEQDEANVTDGSFRASFSNRIARAVYMLEHELGN